MGPAQDLCSYPTSVSHLGLALLLHTKLYRTRADPAHDFYWQTLHVNNV